MKRAIFAAASLAIFSASALASDVNDQGKLLLEQDFGTLTINKIDIGEIHRPKGQKAPLGIGGHQHNVPVAGYIAEGELRLGIEGSETATIKKGQSFYEPEGKTITAFASASRGSVKVISFFLFK
jgi:hypothetical protein